MALPLEKELLSAEDVAALMGIKETTVWRWCREGNLSCLKVGKHWRVRREALENFLRRSERPTTLVGQLRSFLQVPDNVLAIAQNPDLLHRLDTAFFQVGEAQGGLLMKFYGAEEYSEDELRVQFEENGLEVGRLEREGRLLLRPEEGPLDARGDVLRQLLEDVSEDGRTVWAAFNWAMWFDLDTALEQQEKLTELVEARQLVVKTAALEGTMEEWSSTDLRRAQTSHSGTIEASETRLVLGRATPMPSS